jgi:hypothetical protein
MNLIVLSLTGMFCRSEVRFRRLRMCVSSMLGAASEAVFFLVLPGRLFFVAAGVFLLMPVMVLISFGFVGGRVFLRRLSLGWLSAVLLYGAVSAVYSLTGIRILTVYVAILAFFAARFFVRTLAASVHSLQRQLPLTLCWHGRSVRCLGLYDSGNLLCMPQSGEPVHIIAPQTLRRLLGEESGTPQTISYHALGTDCGQICVYRLDQMKIQQQKGTKIVEQPWVGRAQESLLHGKPYQVILHAGVVDNE